MLCYSESQSFTNSVRQQMKLHLCALWVLLLMPVLADKSQLTPLSELALGQEVVGTVHRTVSYGAFLDIGAESDGLLPFFDDASQVFRPGDKLKCRISAINHLEKQVSLSQMPGEGKALQGGGGQRRSSQNVGECSVRGTCTAASALSDRTPQNDTVETMSEQTFPKCSPENVCKNCNPNCGLWASEGKCITGPSDVRQYVRDMCPISCGFCKSGDLHPDRRRDCQDMRDDCQAMAMKGGCHINSSLMLKHCRRSCRVCWDFDPCRPNASDIGLVPKPGDLKKLMERVIKTENVTVLHSDPYVLLVHNVIADEVVDSVQELFSAQWEASLVGGIPGHTKQKSGIRTSDQQWCPVDCEALPPMAELTRRVEEIVGISRRNFEILQILRYKAGQFYKGHHDYIPQLLPMPNGPRVLTFYLYLNDVENGGTTYFPELNLSVPPRKGTALLWPSVLDSDPFAQDNRTYHEGRPPMGDSLKLGVNFWVHQYDHRTYLNRYCFRQRRPRSSYFP